MSKIPEPVTEEVLPESASKSGKNAFYHFCTAWNGRQNYAVCRHAMDHAEKGTLKQGSLCKGAIECGSCEALPMREAEKVSGRSLYFIDRTKQMAANKERIAKRESLLKPRASLGGVGSLLEGRPDGIKTRKPNMQSAPETPIKKTKPVEKDMDQMIHEGSKAMESALSNVNEEK